MQPSKSELIVSIIHNFLFIFICTLCVILLGRITVQPLIFNICISELDFSTPVAGSVTSHTSCVVFLTSCVYMDTSDPHRFLRGIENDHIYASFRIQLSVRHRILCRIEEVV
jgi:hypothetical protein